MDTDERLLPSANFTGDYVTVELCVKFCNSRGFPFAGMQVEQYNSILHYAFVFSISRLAQPNINQFLFKYKKTNTEIG